MPIATSFPRPDPRARSCNRARGRSWTDPFLLAALGIGALLLLSGLGDRALWTDEAETALLARNILRFDVPRAFDGVNYVSQRVVAGREDFDERGIWVLSPWLQLYWAAGSFAVLGESAATARLPFAAVGLACIWLLHRLASDVFGDRRVARLAALLLVACVPFVLHARQARYYPLVAFLGTAAVSAYLRLLERRPRAALWLVLALGLLFHASYAAWVPIVAGLAIHAALFARSRIELGRAAAIGAGVLALVGPWAFFARIDRSSSLIDPSYFAFNALNYAITLNQYVLPLAWIAVTWALARLAPRDAAPRGRALPQPFVGVVLCLVATSLLFASANTNWFFRYVIQLVPVLVLVHAALLVRVADRVVDHFGARAGRFALVALVPLVTLTTLPALIAFPLLRPLEARTARERWADDPLLRRPRAALASPLSELFDLAHELTYPVRGPDSAIAAFLTAHADPNDLVFADYGDLPIAFSTGLTVRGASQGVPYLGKPDWIVSRGFEASGQPLARFAVERGYVTHVLDVADTRWENQPDPYAHRYRTVPAGTSRHPPIVVYERPRESKSPETLTLGVPRGPLPAARRDGPPNVLLVSLDGVRADHVIDTAEVYVGPTRLGALAASGTLFTQCRSTATGTAAAAASLLTGRTPSELGRPGPARACRPGVPTLAEQLRASGYETAAVVPNLTLPVELDLAAGFDRWLGPPPGGVRRADFAVAREARHWLLSRDGTRPWFLWVHLGAASGPYRTTINPFGSLAPFSARVIGSAAIDATPLTLLDHNGGTGGVPAYQQLRGAATAGRYHNMHGVLTLVGDFFAGELVDTLGVIGADDATVVAMVGTHGESLGERGVFFDHGENLDDSVLHVPCIVRVPDAVPAVVDAPVSILDVAPTLAALAGVPAPPETSGRDLSAACRGGAVELGGRSGTPAELYPPQGAGELLAVSGRRYRVELDAGGAQRAFDLSAPEAPPIDPATRDDAELRALAAELEALRARAPAQPGPAIALTPERRAGLVMLGYAEERLDRE